MSIDDIPTPPQSAPLLKVTGLIVASLLTVVGCFLPWVTATLPLLGDVSIKGIDGDGQLILVLSGIATLLLFLRKAEGPGVSLRRKQLWLPTILNAFSFLVALYDTTKITDSLTDPELRPFASIGFGLLLCLFASGTAVVLAIISLRRKIQTNN